PLAFLGPTLAAISLSQFSTPVGDRLNWYLQDFWVPLSSSVTVIRSNQGTADSSAGSEGVAGAEVDAASAAANKASTMKSPSCPLRRLDCRHHLVSQRTKCSQFPDAR